MFWNAVHRWRDDPRRRPQPTSETELKVLLYFFFSSSTRRQITLVSPTHSEGVVNTTGIRFEKVKWNSAISVNPSAKISRDENQIWPCQLPEVFVCSRRKSQRGRRGGYLCIFLIVSSQIADYLISAGHLGDTYMHITHPRHSGLVWNCVCVGWLSDFKYRPTLFLCFSAQLCQCFYPFTLSSCKQNVRNRLAASQRCCLLDFFTSSQEKQVHKKCLKKERERRAQWAWSCVSPQTPFCLLFSVGGNDAFTRPRGREHESLHLLQETSN